MGINPLEDVFRPRQNRPGSNPLQMLAEFKKFASGMTPQQAQQQIQELLRTGQMTQQQLQQLQGMAKQFMAFLR